MNNKKERKEFEIQLNIGNESDLYNTFDKFNNTLSDDVYLYLNNRIQFSRITDKIIIKIFSKNKIDQKNFINVYYKYLDEQINLVNKEGRFNTSKQIWLLCIGIIFISFSLAFSNKINVYSFRNSLNDWFFFYMGICE